MLWNWLQNKLGGAENLHETAEAAKEHFASGLSLEELHEHHAEDLQTTIDHEFRNGSASRFNPLGAVRDHFRYSKIGRLAVEQAEARNEIVEQHHEKLFGIDTKTAMPEAAARGLTWERGPGLDVSQDADDVTLQHEGRTVAGVSEWWDPNKGPRSPETMHVAVETYGLDRGALQDRYATFQDGMRATELWAVEDGLKLHQQEHETDAALEAMRERSAGNPMGFFTKPTVSSLSEASESFYARLTEAAAQKDAGQERGIERGDFDMGR